MKGVNEHSKEFRCHRCDLGFRLKDMHIKEEGGVAWPYCPECATEIDMDRELKKIWGNNNRDMINNPDHYTDKSMEMTESFKYVSSPEEFRGFLKGQIHKYLYRYQDKGGVFDLEKAQWYLSKLIEEETDNG